MVIPVAIPISQLIKLSQMKMFYLPFSYIGMLKLIHRDVVITAVQ